MMNSQKEIITLGIEGSANKIGVGKQPREPIFLILERDCEQ